MEITLYESEALFDDLADEWGSLLTHSARNQIFFTPVWLQTWWSVYQPGTIWALALRDEAGQLMGIAPWYRTTEADGTRVIGAIGGVEVTDYIDVIVRDEHEEAVFGALTDWLVAHTSEFDQLRIHNIPGESGMIRLWPEMLRAQGFSVETGVEDVCPVVPLPDDFLDYIASLDKKNRHELRRKLRKATGKSDWYFVGPEHDLDAELATFFELMAASSPDKAEFLQHNQNRRFFEAIVPRVAEEGWLKLAMLTVAGVPTATYLNFDYDNRILVYNSGYDPEVHSQLSPGIVLLGRLIQHAVSCKREAFDFLQGDESYKYDMGGQDTTVCWLAVSPGE